MGPTHTVLSISTHTCSIQFTHLFACLILLLSSPQSFFFFFFWFALCCPLFVIAILTWPFPFSSHLSLFFTHTVSTVCIKRPVIHHRVRAECSPCCTPVCRLLVCQPSRAGINHPILRHWNHQGGSDRDRRERERKLEGGRKGGGGHTERQKNPG